MVNEYQSLPEILVFKEKIDVSRTPELHLIFLIRLFN